MDPNANFLERIELAKDGKQDSDRFHELTEAYAEWRSSGGFPASRVLRDRLLTLIGVKKGA